MAEKAEKEQKQHFADQRGGLGVTQREHLGRELLSFLLFLSPQKAFLVVIGTDGPTGLPEFALQRGWGGRWGGGALCVVEVRK